MEASLWPAAQSLTCHLPPADKKAQAFGFTFFKRPPGARSDCASVVAPYGLCGGVPSDCLVTKNCSQLPLPGVCCSDGFECTSDASLSLRCLPPLVPGAPSPSPSPSTSPAGPPSSSPVLPPFPSPSPAPSNNDDYGGAADPQPLMLETKATYTTNKPMDAGHADGLAANTTLMRIRTPDALVPQSSRLTLTLSGSWEAADGSSADNRSGRIAIALPPGATGIARPALATTDASHFSDAEGASADFSYSVSW